MAFSYKQVDLYTKKFITTGTNTTNPLTEVVANSLLEAILPESARDQFSVAKLDAGITPKMIEENHPDPENNSLLLVKGSRAVYGPPEYRDKLASFFDLTRDYPYHRYLTNENQELATLEKAKILLIDDETGETGLDYISQDAGQQILGDSHGKCSYEIAESLGQPNRLMQFRALGTEMGQEWFAKGTLQASLANTLSRYGITEEVDLILPLSSFKGLGKSRVQPGILETDMILTNHDLSKTRGFKLASVVQKLEGEGLAWAIAQQNEQINQFNATFSNTDLLYERLLSHLAPVDLDAENWRDCGKYDYIALREDYESGNKQLLYTYDYRKFLNEVYASAARNLSQAGFIKAKGGMIYCDYDLKNNEIAVPNLPEGEQIAAIRSPIIQLTDISLVTNRHIPALKNDRGEQMQGVIACSPQMYDQILFTTRNFVEGRIADLEQLNQEQAEGAINLIALKQLNPFNDPNLRNTPLAELDGTVRERLTEDLNTWRESYNSLLEANGLELPELDLIRQDTFTSILAADFDGDTIAALSQSEYPEVYAAIESAILAGDQITPKLDKILPDPSESVASVIARKQDPYILGKTANLAENLQAMAAESRRIRASSQELKYDYVRQIAPVLFHSLKQPTEAELLAAEADDQIASFRDYQVASTGENLLSAGLVQEYDFLNIRDTLQLAFEERPVADTDLDRVLNIWEQYLSELNTKVAQQNQIAVDSFKSDRPVDDRLINDLFQSTSYLGHNLKNQFNAESYKTDTPQIYNSSQNLALLTHNVNSQISRFPFDTQIERPEDLNRNPDLFADVDELVSIEEKSEIFDIYHNYREDQIISSRYRDKARIDKGYSLVIKDQNREIEITNLLSHEHYPEDLLDNLPDFKIRLEPISGINRDHKMFASYYDSTFHDWKPLGTVCNVCSTQYKLESPEEITLSNQEQLFFRSASTVEQADALSQSARETVTQWVEGIPANRRDAYIKASYNLIRNSPSGINFFILAFGAEYAAKFQEFNKTEIKVGKLVTADPEDKRSQVEFLERYGSGEYGEFMVDIPDTQVAKYQDLDHQLFYLDGTEKIHIGSVTDKAVFLPPKTKFMGSLELDTVYSGELELADGSKLGLAKMDLGDLASSDAEQAMQLYTKKVSEPVSYDVFLGDKQLGKLDPESSDVYEYANSGTNRTEDYSLLTTGTGRGKSIRIKSDKGGYSFRVIRLKEYEDDPLIFNGQTETLTIKAKSRYVNKVYGIDSSGENLYLGNLKSNKDAEILGDQPRPGTIRSFPSVLSLKIEPETIDRSEAQDYYAYLEPASWDFASNPRSDYFLEKSAQFPLIVNYSQQEWAVSGDVSAKATTSILIPEQQSDRLITALKSLDLPVIQDTGNQNVVSAERRGFNVFILPASLASAEKIAELAENLDLETKIFDSISGRANDSYDKYLANFSLAPGAEAYTLAEDYPEWQVSPIALIQKEWGGEDTAVATWQINSANQDSPALIAELSAQGFKFSQINGEYLLKDSDLNAEQRSELLALSESLTWQDGLAVPEHPSEELLNLVDQQLYGSESAVISQFDKLDLADRVYLSANFEIPLTATAGDFAQAQSGFAEHFQAYVTPATAIVYQHSKAGTFNRVKNQLADALGSKRVAAYRQNYLALRKAKLEPNLVTGSSLSAVGSIPKSLAKFPIPRPEDLKRGQIPVVPVVFNRDLQDPLVAAFQVKESYVKYQDLQARFKQTLQEQPELVTEITKRGGKSYLICCEAESSNSFLAGKGVNDKGYHNSPIVSALISSYSSLLKEQSKAGISRFDIKGRPLAMNYPLIGNQDLPVDSTMAALRGYGRSHTTRNFDVYQKLKIKAGDLFLITGMGKTVVARAGKQYRLSDDLRQNPEYRQAWANAEKHEEQTLDTLFAKKLEQGKAVYGFEFEPLGDFVNNQLVEFPAVEARYKDQPRSFPAKFAPESAFTTAAEKSQDRLAKSTIEQLEPVKNTTLKTNSETMDKPTLNNQAEPENPQGQEYEISESDLNDIEAFAQGNELPVNTSNIEAETTSKVVLPKHEPKFNEFGRTEGQQQVYDSLRPFLAERQLTGKDNIFVINGRPGTGKTHVIQQVIKDHLQEYGGDQVGFMAPTHSATDVIASMAHKNDVPVQDSVTLASFLGIKPTYDPQGKEQWDFTEQYRILDTGNLDDLQGSFKNFTTMVLDEGSMPIKEQYDFMTRLCDEAGIKLIIMGDRDQVPPINELESQVFLDSEVKNRINLTEVVRYGGAIAQEADKLRGFIDQARSAKTEADLDQIPLDQSSLFTSSQAGDVKTAKSSDWEKQMLDLFTSKEFQQNPNYVKAIAYRNARVEELNTTIREALVGKNASEYVVGDLITNKSTLNLYDPDFPDNDPKEVGKNGRFKILEAEKGELKIETVDQQRYLKGLKVWHLKVRNLSDEKDYSAQFIAKESQAQLKQAFQGLFSSARREINKQEKARKFARAYELKRSVAEGKYNYAMTTHQAQGGTFENVALDRKDIAVAAYHATKAQTFTERQRKTKEYLSLVYTAGTRAKSSILVLQDKVRQQAASQTKTATPVKTQPQLKIDSSTKPEVKAAKPQVKITTSKTSVAKVKSQTKQTFSFVSLANNEGGVSSNSGDLLAKVTESLAGSSYANTPKPSLRVWRDRDGDKTSNSVLASFQGLDLPKLKQNAAWLGKTSDRPAVSIFIADNKGDNSLYSFNLNKSSQETRDILKQAGLTSYNLVGNSETQTQVVVLDSKRQKLDLISQIVEVNQATNFGVYHGTAQQIRANEYDQIIGATTERDSERGADSKPRGVSTKAPRVNPVGKSPVNESTDRSGGGDNLQSGGLPRSKPRPRLSQPPEDYSIADLFDTSDSTSWIEKQTPLVRCLCNKLSGFLKHSPDASRDSQGNINFANSRYQVTASKVAEGFQMTLASQGTKVMDALFKDGQWQPNYLPNSGVKDVDIAFFDNALAELNSQRNNPQPSREADREPEAKPRVSAVKPKIKSSSLER